MTGEDDEDAWICLDTTFPSSFRAGTESSTRKVTGLGYLWELGRNFALNMLGKTNLQDPLSRVVFIQHHPTIDLFLTG